MSEVRRFRFFSTCDCGNVFGYDFKEDENGGWVDYHDYKNLEQQNIQLQAEYNESREYNSKLANDNFEFIKANANLEQQKAELMEIIKHLEVTENIEFEIDGCLVLKDEYRIFVDKNSKEENIINKYK